MRAAILALTDLLCLGPARAADDPAGPTKDPTQVRPGAYVLDRNHGKITWSVSHLGYSTCYGQFTGVTGRLDLDPKAPERSRLSVAVPLGGAVAGNPRLEQDLATPDFFDAQTFPSATFAVQYVVRERNRVVLFSGAGAELTGKTCSPNGIQWTYDTYSYAHAMARGLLDRGGDTWFFITADYALGKELENEATAEIMRRGGKVMGSIRHPLGTADFSSFLLQAQASGAKVVALANAGTDAVNAVKQAHEFGLVEGGQRLAGLLMTAAETAKIPLSVTGGMIQVAGFTGNGAFQVVDSGEQTSKGA